MGNQLKKNAVLAANAGMAILMLTACGGATEAATPSASRSVSPTPSPTPSPSKSTSMPKQLASAIYSSRQSFLKAAKEWQDNNCRDVLPTAKPGLEKMTCAANLITLESLAKAITIQLDSNKPWPDEVSTLADGTYRYVNQVAGVANTTDYSSSNVGIVDLATKLAVMKLESWAPYMGS